MSVRTRDRCRQEDERDSVARLAEMNSGAQHRIDQESVECIYTTKNRDIETFLTTYMYTQSYDDLEMGSAVKTLTTVLMNELCNITK